MDEETASTNHGDSFNGIGGRTIRPTSTDPLKLERAVGRHVVQRDLGIAYVSPAFSQLDKDRFAPECALPPIRAWHVSQLMCLQKTIRNDAATLRRSHFASDQASGRGIVFQLPSGCGSETSERPELSRLIGSGERGDGHCE